MIERFTYKKREKWYYQNSLVYGGKEGVSPHINNTLMKKLLVILTHDLAIWFQITAGFIKLLPPLPYRTNPINTPLLTASASRPRLDDNV